MLKNVQHFQDSCTSAGRSKRHDLSIPVSRSEGRADLRLILCQIRKFKTAAPGIDEIRKFFRDLSLVEIIDAFRGDFPEECAELRIVLDLSETIKASVLPEIELPHSFGELQLSFHGIIEHRKRPGITYAKTFLRKPDSRLRSVRDGHGPVALKEQIKGPEQSRNRHGLASQVLPLILYFSILDKKVCRGLSRSDSSSVHSVKLIVFAAVNQCKTAAADSGMMGLCHRECQRDRCCGVKRVSALFQDGKPGSGSINTVGTDSPAGSVRHRAAPVRRPHIDLFFFSQTKHPLFIQPIQYFSNVRR